MDVFLKFATEYSSIIWIVFLSLLVLAMILVTLQSPKKSPSKNSNKTELNEEGSFDVAEKYRHLKKRVFTDCDHEPTGCDNISRDKR